MLDAVGRGRLHPQMRGARYGDVPGFRYPPDRRAACAQCQDLAGAAQFEIRGRGAAGIESGGLTPFTVICERKRSNPESQGKTGLLVASAPRSDEPIPQLFPRSVASRLYGPPP